MLKHLKKNIEGEYETFMEIYVSNDVLTIGENVQSTEKNEF